VQSVERLATGWANERSEFESWQSQKCSLLRIVQPSSGSYPASYAMGTGFFPSDKAA
jgi:hypothetical protein